MVDGREFNASEVAVVIREVVGINICSFHGVDGFADVVVHLLESVVFHFAVFIFKVGVCGSITIS